MGVLDKELHVLGNMDMDDNGSIVLDVEVEILKIFGFKSKSFDFFQKRRFSFIMQFFRPFVHVIDGFNLKLGQSIFFIYFKRN